MSSKPIYMTDDEVLAWQKSANDFYDKHRNRAGFYGDWWDEYQVPSDDKKENKCDHDWHEDSYFSRNKYITCKKCGAKKEEEDKK